MAPKKPTRKPTRNKRPMKKGGGPRKPKQPKQPRRSAFPARAVQENAAAKALAHKIAGVASEMKGQDVVVLDVRGKASYADYVVVASGDNERLVAALADGIDDKLRPDGVRPMSTEGSGQGNWVLLDYGDVVVHLFQQDARVFYDLEGLWADAPRERVG
ncbi:MAG: ribosome silencing factor [Myxococcaceae bacterium]